MDFRDDRVGAWSILKYDIHTLVSPKSEQVDVFQHERNFKAGSSANISHQLKTALTSMMIMCFLRLMGLIGEGLYSYPVIAIMSTLMDMIGNVVV